MWSGLPALSRWLGVLGSRSPLAGGASMSWIMDSDWLTVFFVSLAFLSLFTVVEKFVKKKIRERRGLDPMGSSERKNKINELEICLSEVTTERDKYKEEFQQKKSHLEGLDVKLTAAMVQVSLAKGQRDEYKQEVEDREKKLSDCWSAKEALHKDYGKAVLWAAGRNWKSRELSVAVQYVRVEDAKLAKQIRGLLAVHLQGDSYSKETGDHILLPFENPSCTRVVLFSDSEVGSEVQDTFNRYHLINEKMAYFEQGFASGNVPEVDIAIVVFPDD